MRKVPANGGNAEAMTCIAVVNEVLGANFGPGYTPISPTTTARTARCLQWIAVGMSLEDDDATAPHEGRGVQSEKINGEMPRSLASSPSGCSKSGRSNSASCRCRLSHCRSRAGAARETQEASSLLGDVDDADVAAQLGVKR
jgi:hypothetical protein